MKILFQLFFVATLFANKASAQNSPIIIASINPIYQILLAITEDKNNSILLIDPQRSEHDYELRKSDIGNLTKADLVFYIDDSLEKNFSVLIKNFSLENKSYSVSKIAGVKILKQKNNPTKLDPHIWLNPQNAVRIAEFMAQKICEIDQKNCQKYQKNYQNFSQKITKKQIKIAKDLEPLRNVGFVFYHDGYQYFEEYFNLKSRMILSYDGAAEMNIKSLRKFDELVKTGKVKCLFGELIDEKNTAQKLAKKYGLNFVALSAIGSDANQDYFDLISSLADKMKGCEG